MRGSGRGLNHSASSLRLKENGNAYLQLGRIVRVSLSNLMTDSWPGDVTYLICRGEAFSGGDAKLRGDQWLILQQQVSDYGDTRGPSYK
jgi:hypothetical protein